MPFGEPRVHTRVWEGQKERGDMGLSSRDPSAGCYCSHRSKARSLHGLFSPQRKINKYMPDRTSPPGWVQDSLVCVITSALLL